MAPGCGPRPSPKREEGPWREFGLFLRVPAVTVLVKAGLGAGFHAGEAGATRQGGVEVSWGGPFLAITGSWERVWNLAELPSLSPSGQDLWSLGLRWRFEVADQSTREGG